MGRVHVDEHQPVGVLGQDIDIVQLTDGIALMLESQRVYAYECEGTRYDGGTPLGILQASLEMALRRDELHQGALEILRQLNPDLLSEITG